MHFTCYDLRKVMEEFAMANFNFILQIYLPFDYELQKSHKN